MAFDPDAYLAGNESGGFNPDEYLASKKDPYMGAMGLIEAGANIASGMGASAVGGLAGLGTLATGGSLDEANNRLSSIQDKFTYAPRSVEGKAIAHVAGLPFEYATKAGQWLGEAAGKPFGLEDEGGLAGNLAAGAGLTLLGGRAALKSSPKWIPAAQSAFDMAKNEAKNIRAPSAPIEYAPSKMAELARDSGNNAGRIEGAAAADRLGIGLNAGTSNPTWGNRLFSRIAGKNEVDNQLAMDSKMGWTDNAKKVAGVEDGMPLSPENIKAAREKMGQPYREVGAIRNIATSDELVKAIDSASNLEGMTPAIADYIAQAVSPLLDKLKTATAEGASGIDLINLTRKLRKDANTTYKNKNPEVGAVDLADARMAVSKALEDLAAKRLLQMEAEAPGKGYGDLAARWKEARQKIAESHVVENATDPHTYITDPVKVAKHAKKALVTGTLDDMARVASNFPEIANIAAEPSNVPFHASRYGVGGLLGGAVGGLIAGAPGIAAGTLAGGALTGPFQMALRRYVTSKGYQGRNAIPTDFRPAPPAPLDPRTIPINKDIPYNGLPAVPGAMVIPQSWREGINAAMEKRGLPVMSEDLLPHGAGGAVMTPQAGRTPLPSLPPVDPLGLPPVLQLPPQARLGRSEPIGIPDQLLPLSEQYPQGIPIGAAEGRMPQASTPLPKLYEDNPLIQMAEQIDFVKKSKDPKLMQEALDVGVEFPLLQQLNRRWTKDTGAALRRLLYETKDNHGIVKTKSLKDLMQ